MLPNRYLTVTGRGPAAVHIGASLSLPTSMAVGINRLPKASAATRSRQDLPFSIPFECSGRAAPVVLERALGSARDTRMSATLCRLFGFFVALLVVGANGACLSAHSP
jgi:hypothetical protein